MGMVTLHLVIGVGVFILPLFLLLFSLVVMSLAHLYIVIGSVSFVSSVLTTIVLVTKFVNQPAAHGFFAYSDTIASALMSMGLLLDGILYLLPRQETPCYQYKLIYGLFIVPIITSFFSILGMAIERFQAFALYRDRRKLTRRFSIAWFCASWTLAFCFLVILLAQIVEKDPHDRRYHQQTNEISDYESWTPPGGNPEQGSSFYISILDMDLFPGPHSSRNVYQPPRPSSVLAIMTTASSTVITSKRSTTTTALTSAKSTTTTQHLATSVNNALTSSDSVSSEELSSGGNDSVWKQMADEPSSWPKMVECIYRYKKRANDPIDDSGLWSRCMTWIADDQKSPRLNDDLDNDDDMEEESFFANMTRNVFHFNDSTVIVDGGSKGGNKSFKIYGNESKGGTKCQVSSKPFIMYYLILVFLLCFATPVLITTSLNVFIHSAVRSTTYEVIGHHQWLTLLACVLMWGPSLTERLLAKWDIYEPPLVVSVFLFLLGHTHNLLRSVLHAVFAQQIHSITWRGNQLDMNPQHQDISNNGGHHSIEFKWAVANSSSRKKRSNKVRPSKGKKMQQGQEMHKRQDEPDISTTTRNDIEAIQTTCI